MRPILAILVLLALSPTEARVPSSRHRPSPAIGFEEIHIPNGSEPDLIGGIWYPTSGVPRTEPIEGVTQFVAESGPVRGTALPLVVLSHGGGGSYAGHYDTALALARAGYVVASLSHAGDSREDQSKALLQWRRPAQLSRLIDYVVTGWSSHARIDPSRIGAFGFSNGGFTVLVAAGATPDFRAIDPYCEAHPSHDLCTALTGAGVRSVAPFLPGSEAWSHDARIRAIAAAAPAFGFTFDRAGLAAIHVPVLLWRGADDRHQPNPWYEEHIRSLLPQPPTYHVEPNAGHYAFLPPCDANLARVAPDICRDKRGFDRAAFHRRLNADLVRFFDRSLGGTVTD